MSLMLALDAANQSYLLWGFILLAITIVLVVLEFFVPSGGIIGACAGVGAIGSVAAFFAYSPKSGLVALSIYIVLTPIVIWGIFKFWLHSPIGRAMILGGDGLLAGDDDARLASERKRQERLAQLRELIGAEGETITPLRPVGVVKIAGQRIDALAENGAIDARTKVVVVEVYDNQIKVRPAVG